MVKIKAVSVTLALSSRASVYEAYVQTRFRQALSGGIVQRLRSPGADAIEDLRATCVTEYTLQQGTVKDGGVPVPTR